jgi:hypothetical protein
MPAANAIKELMNGMMKARRRSERGLFRRPRAIKGEKKSKMLARMANAALALV